MSKSVKSLEKNEKEYQVRGHKEDKLSLNLLKKRQNKRKDLEDIDIFMNTIKQWLL